MNADLTAKCAYIFKRLKANGTKSIDISFSGSGDDGRLEITDWSWVENNQAKEDETDETPFGMDFVALIERTAEDILEFYNVDYCNCNGNEGYIFFDVMSGHIETNFRTYGETTEKLYI
jgi:hypothetical protein